MKPTERGTGTEFGSNVNGSLLATCDTHASVGMQSQFLWVLELSYNSTAAVTSNHLAKRRSKGTNRHATWRANLADPLSTVTGHQSSGLVQEELVHFAVKMQCVNKA